MSMDDDDRDLAQLLADPSLWLEPGAAVEDSVLASVRAERAAPVLVDGHPSDVVVSMRSSRRRVWSTQISAGLVGAAAAALIAVVVVRSTDDDQAALTPADSSFELVGTDLSPGLVGTAEVAVQPSGTLIRMAVSGLPRREGGDFYQAWLKSCDGARLVPIGTFHDMDRVAGWAGVSVDDFPVLTITREQVAGPKDAQQGSSGDVVVTGAISPCPKT